MAPPGGRISQEPSLSFPVPVPAPMSRLPSSDNYNTRAKVSFNGNTFEVALNLEDFKPEEIYVKTEGTTLSVSAKHEEPGRCQQFEEKFSLPTGVSPEHLNSALSSSGVLTISAPCTSPAPLQLQHQQTGCSEMVPPSVVYDDQKLGIELDVKDYRPESLDVKVEGEEVIVTASQDVEDRTRVFQQRFSLPRGIRPEQVTSSLTADGLLIITANREPEDLAERRETQPEQLQPPSGTREKSGGGGRWREFCEGNQYKIMVNMGGINPEDLTIKTLADNVIVEVRQEDGGTLFSQSFQLPSNVRPETVTSTLSGEGILTISAPLTGN